MLRHPFRSFRSKKVTTVNSCALSNHTIIVAKKFCTELSGQFISTPKCQGVGRKLTIIKGCRFDSSRCRVGYGNELKTKG